MSKLFGSINLEDGGTNQYLKIAVLNNHPKKKKYLYHLEKTQNT